MITLRLFLSLLALATINLSAAKQNTPLLDASGNPSGFRTLAIGDVAPNFNLPGIDGRTHTLAEHAGPDVLMILFTSNHCPTSHGIERRLQQLRDDFRAKSFGIVAINPNHPDGLGISELGFGEYSDSFEDMKPYAAKLGWDFPYLYDGETQQVARAYGCLATPHVFIFDKERRLRYAGSFDDSRYPDESTVKAPYARLAIEALLAGKPVANPLTKPFGCSTKWREKQAKHVAAATEWQQIPVTVELIDAQGVAALRKNGTANYRFINVWATWCGPCVEEFPSLVSISQQYSMRPFEFITISMDDPKSITKAQAFLQKQGAGSSKRVQAGIKKDGRTTNHYLFNNADQSALISALDSEWPGPIPHTVLVAPDGRIVWRHNGAIDPDAARAAIIKELTPYWPLPKNK